jgi:hypothetical protein
MSFKDGQFGKLKIITVVITNALYLCECRCGNRAEFSYYQLNHRSAIECADCKAARPKAHGAHSSALSHFGQHRRCITVKDRRTGKRKHKYFCSGEFNTWKGMKERCFGAWHPKFPNYGARGIGVCNAWLAFQNFVADMGPRPKGHSLERKNVHGHYEKSNCIWLPMKLQPMNRTTSLCNRGKSTKVESWDVMEARLGDPCTFDTVTF